MAEGNNAVLEWDGPLSPPRRNGEIVFDTVWQSRLFGMTMALYESGAFRWEEFRDQLIAAIARAGLRAPSAGISSQGSVVGPASDFGYWDCWMEAFEQLVAAKGICAEEAVAARVAQLAARPHGHDH